MSNNQQVEIKLDLSKEHKDNINDKAKEIKKSKEKVDETKNKFIKVKEQDKSEKKSKKDRENDDEKDVVWESVDENSKITSFLGKNYRTGPWKRISSSKIYVNAKEVHYLNLDHDDVIGEHKAYLEYKDGRKLLVYEGTWDESVPIGTHIQYLPDPKEKYTEWICKKHFSKKKTGVLVSYDTRIKGKEKIGLKCENPNPFREDNIKVDIKQISKKGKTVKELQEKCTELNIKFTKKETKSVLEDKIKNYLKENKDKDNDE